MKIQETQTVERELHVAPCLECGGTDIQLSDSGYSSFNVGGGKCKKCGHEVTQGNLGCFPTIDQLAAIWNRANDIPALIQAEKQKMAEAEARIVSLKLKAGAMAQLKPLADSELSDLMTVEEYQRYTADGFLNVDDGVGYWATSTGKSELSTRQPQPAWATHVLWFNR